MGEYEPRDSRNVTQRQDRAPGEPPRTGPREDEARANALQDELKDKGGGKDKPTARNVQGEKEDGFAEHDDGDAAEADESSVPLGN